MIPDAAGGCEVRLLADSLAALMATRGIRVVAPADCMEIASELLTAYERKIK